MTDPLSLRPRRAAPWAGIDEWHATAEGAQWRVALDPAEPVFAGHYPGEPILPGIYVFESLCQGVERVFALRGQRARARSVRSMRFLLPFAPGDELRIVAAVPPLSEGGDCAVSATILRGERKAGSARVVFRAVEAADA